ncbi:MAG: TrkH family potassium uptake protein [Alphaproteobacteria bacterium]|nr:TrkH family potassium uptake protein [Alphaproteobacteria bacterium]
MWQLVLMFNGYFVSILGCAMMVVGAYDMYETGSSWSCFMNAALVALFIGLALLLSNRTDNRSLSMKQGYLLTATSWVSVCLVSTLPFLFFDTNLNFADVFFEAVSGITGTGATVFADVEKLPRSILLWRSILNLTGGIGVVIFASALLPFLGIGGMQIFQRENSDVNDKFMPKFQYIAQRIIFVYVILVAACVVSLYFAGMNWFDAVNHGFSAAATGGFSTKNNSIAFYDSPKIETVVIFFMLLSALPMTYYVMLAQNKLKHSIRSVQVGAFLKAVFLAVLVMSVWLRVKGVYPDFVQAFRFAAFNVVSVITTCGLSSTDYLSWEVLQLCFLLLLCW